MNLRSEIKFALQSMSECAVRWIVRYSGPGDLADIILILRRRGGSHDEDAIPFNPDYVR